MAERRAGFVTGANAKIQIDGKTFAFAQDVGYDINVVTVPVEGIGRYEAFSNEPVSYSCSGNLTVTRYTARAAVSGITKVDADGNTIEQITQKLGGNLAQHLSPAALLASETFDLVIYEKTCDTTADYTVMGITDCRLTRRTGTLNKRGVLMDQYTFVGILAGDYGNNTTGLSASESGDGDLT